MKTVKGTKKVIKKNLNKIKRNTTKQIKKNSHNAILNYSFILLLIFAFIIIALSLINSNALKKIDSDYYVLNYDKSWKVIKSNDTEVLLENSINKANLTLKVSELKNEDRYYAIDDMIDDLIYQLETDYPNYYLLNKAYHVYTKNEYGGYEILYEGDSNNLLKVFIKVDNYLYEFTYLADCSYFDVTLDNILGIIYNFEPKQFTNIKIDDKVKLKLKGVSYNKSKELDKLVGNTNAYEIYSNNYSVSYTIPDIFKETMISSTNGYYEFKNNNGSITISTSVVRSNMLEYLDSNNSANIYQEYHYLQKNKDFKEYLTKLSDDKYLYHITYKSTSYTYNVNLEEKQVERNNEAMIIVTKLDRNHLFKVAIDSQNYPITEKFIDSIKINKMYNYAYHIDSTLVDDYLVGSLQKYHEDKTLTIKLKLPKDYLEIDDRQNVYQKRIFATKYSDKIGDYQLYVKYSFIDNIEQEITDLNDLYPISYGAYNYLEYSGTYGNYDVYEGDYTYLTGELYSNINRTSYKVYENVLFIKVESGYLMIDIIGKDYAINDPLYKQVLNYEKVYE